MKDFIRLYEKNGKAKNRFIRKDNIINVREVGLADYYLVDYKDNDISESLARLIFVLCFFIIGFIIAIVFYCLTKISFESDYVLKDDLEELDENETS